jgi:hypothetical protein
MKYTNFNDYPGYGDDNTYPVRPPWDDEDVDEEKPRKKVFIPRTKPIDFDDDDCCF